MKLNQKGYTLPETMLALFLMALTGVAIMRLSENMKDSSTIVSRANDLTRTMLEIRTIFRNPEVCTLNFKDLGNADKLTEIKEIVAVGQEPKEAVFAEGKAVAKNDYIIEKMQITKLDEVRNRANVTFWFKNQGRSKGVASVSKTISLFVRATGGKITECIDPVTLSSDSILKKLCYDADPWNFDADPNNNNSDCTENVIHLVAEVKQIYCSNSSFLKYSAGKCQPLDAGMDCGAGSFLKGYDKQGGKICYSSPPPPVFPLPVDCIDTSWTLASNPADTCSGDFVNEMKCGETRPSSTPGTKNCLGLGCTGGVRTWGVLNACTANLPDANDNSSATANDNTPPGTGNYSFSCANGVWSNTGENCTPENCVPQTVNWTENSEACTADTTSITSHNSTAQLTDVTGTTGTASFLCNNGYLEVQGGASCAAGTTTGSSTNGNSTGNSTGDLGQNDLIEN